VSWKSFALGEVCIVKRGTTITFKEAIEGEIPVVAGGLKPTYYHNLANRLGNTITISGSGANAGFVNFWNQPIFASDCSTVEVVNNNLDITYVYYFLLSKQQFIYNELRSGAAQPHVYGKDIAKIVISVPPLVTQQKIVAKLDGIFAEIDTATAAAEANASNAEALFQSYLTEVFERGGDGWERKTIEEITDKTKNVSPDKSPDLEFTYVDVSSVSNTSYSIISTQKLLGKDAPSRAKKNIITNDILFATVRPTLKRIAIVPEFLENQVASTGYVVLRTNKKNYYKFLFYFLFTRTFNEAMESLQRGASYPAVTDSDVKLQKLSVPSYEEQYKISEKLEQINTGISIKINSELRKIEELKALKQAILQKAFSGELVKD
jgi:type I restriction enzyme S subunit